MQVLAHAIRPLIVLGLVLAPARADVLFKGREYAVDELPAEAGRAAAEAAARWEPWAAAHGYTAALNADGRVLLLTDQSGRRLKDELERVEHTVALVDRLAPRSGTLGPMATGGAVEEAGAPRDSSWSRQWTDDGPGLETETVVVLRAVDGESYVAALDQIAGEHAYMRGWAAGAKQLSGFVLERPLCAAFLVDGAGSEEWDARNELVHRLAQLLISRRFGQQPYWLKTGIAWQVEYEALASLYCFPYRDEFVYASEHGDWETDLRSAHKEVKTLEMAALTDWERGTYEPERARRAFGLARFVALHHPEAMSRILEDLRALRDERGVVARGVREAPGRWLPGRAAGLLSRGPQVPARKRRIERRRPRRSQESACRSSSTAFVSASSFSFAARPLSAAALARSRTPRRALGVPNLSAQLQSLHACLIPASFSAMLRATVSRLLRSSSIWAAVSARTRWDDSRISRRSFGAWAAWTAASSSSP